VKAEEKMGIIGNHSTRRTTASTKREHSLALSRSAETKLLSA